MPERRQDPSPTHIKATPVFELRDLVRAPDPELLAAVYERVLAPAFDEDELESLEEITEQVADGTRLRMLAALGPGGEPVGAVTSDWYPDAGVLLIGYLAVSAASRGGGVGGRIMSRALAGWTDELRPELCLAEVEDPRFFPVTEHGDPSARVRFYERLGGRIVALPYFQPRLAADTNRVHHLMLMSLLPQSADANQVRTAPLATFLDQYFSSCEGPGVFDEPDFRALRETVLSKPAAELLTGAELDRLPVFEGASGLSR
jgi:GNAT superfamily N-acetyltransferase